LLRHGRLKWLLALLIAATVAGIAVGLDKGLEVLNEMKWSAVDAKLDSGESTEAFFWFVVINLCFGMVAGT